MLVTLSSRDTKGIPGSFLVIKEKDKLFCDHYNKPRHMRLIGISEVTQPEAKVVAQEGFPCLMLIILILLIQYLKPHLQLC